MHSNIICLQDHPNKADCNPKRSGMCNQQVDKPIRGARTNTPRLSQLKAARVCHLALQLSR